MNNTLGMIKWKQMVFLGKPEFGCEVQPIDFAAFVRACVGVGMTIKDPEQYGSMLDEALATEVPVIVEAVVDRPCLPRRRKSPSNKRRISPSLWLSASQTGPRSHGRCSLTKCARLSKSRGE